MALVPRTRALVLMVENTSPVFIRVSVAGSTMSVSHLTTTVQTTILQSARHKHSYNRTHNRSLVDRPPNKPTNIHYAKCTLRCAELPHKYSHNRSLVNRPPNKPTNIHYANCTLRCRIAQIAHDFLWQVRAREFDATKSASQARMDLELDADTSPRYRRGLTMSQSMRP